MTQDTFQELQQVENDLIHDIVMQIQSDGYTPDLIIGLSRGGLLPAIVLSHALKVQVVPVPWSTRDYKDQDISYHVREQMRTATAILVVDDINDSGVTFTGLMNAMGHDAALKTKWASLYQRDGSSFQSNYVGDYIHSDVWINFSWEVQGKAMVAEESTNDQHC